MWVSVLFVKFLERFCKVMTTRKKRAHSRQRLSSVCWIKIHMINWPMISNTLTIQLTVRRAKREVYSHFGGLSMKKPNGWRWRQWYGAHSNVTTISWSSHAAHMITAKQSRGIFYTTGFYSQLETKHMMCTLVWKILLTQKPFINPMWASCVWMSTRPRATWRHVACMTVQLSFTTWTKIARRTSSALCQRTATPSPCGRLNGSTMTSRIDSAFAPSRPMAKSRCGRWTRTSLSLRRCLSCARTSAPSRAFALPFIQLTRRCTCAVLKKALSSNVSLVKCTTVMTDPLRLDKVRFAILGRDQGSRRCNHVGEMESIPSRCLRYLWTG